MKAYVLKRQYLYGEKIVAIVEGEERAKILAKKWDCKIYPCPDKVWTQLEEKL